MAICGMKYWRWMVVGLAMMAAGGCMNVYRVQGFQKKDPVVEGGGETMVDGDVDVGVEF